MAQTTTLKTEAASVDMIGLKCEDLMPEVDDVVGAAAFLQLSENGQTMFE